MCLPTPPSWLKVPKSLRFVLSFVLNSVLWSVFPEFLYKYFWCIKDSNLLSFMLLFKKSGQSFSNFCSVF